MRGEAGKPTVHQLLKQLVRSMGEQHLADPGGMQGKAPRLLGLDRDGTPAGDLLHVQHLLAVQHREVHVLVCGLVEVLHERDRDITEGEAPHCQRAGFPQSQPDPVPAVTTRLEHTQVDQLTSEPVRG